MKRKMILFLTVVLAVLTLLIYGVVNEQRDLVQLGLGGLAIYILADWVLPALRRPTAEPGIELPREEARPALQHS